MTREEIIKEYETAVAAHAAAAAAGIKGAEKSYALFKAGLNALRPVSREQAEKVWRGEWNYSHTTETDHFAVVKCSKCGHKAFAMALYVKDGNFCPACRAAQTDEAVEITMRRLEALKDDC